MQDDNEGFMDNERLYDMIEKLSDKLNDVYLELQETRSDMRKYNGIRKDVADNSEEIEELSEHVHKNRKRLNQMEAEEAGEENQREKIYWVVIVILSFSQLLQIFEVI